MREVKSAYKSESELCADFITWAAGQGWKSYAETAGWDLILVDGNGRQFGIQAKLRFNATLLRQTIPAQHEDAGPDFRGILLPKHCGEVEGVCRAMGLGFFWPDASRQWRKPVAGLMEFRPTISSCNEEWNPSKRCTLPEYVPDVAAGASGPIQLTEWKISALRVCATLELKGSISRKEIRAFGIDARRWTHCPNGWLKPAAEAGRYLRGERLNFDKQHPVVYAQIKSELMEAGGAQ